MHMNSKRRDRETAKQRRGREEKERERERWKKKREREREGRKGERGGKETQSKEEEREKIENVGLFPLKTYASGRHYVNVLARQANRNSGVTIMTWHQHCVAHCVTHWVERHGIGSWACWLASWPHSEFQLEPGRSDEASAITKT